MDTSQDVMSESELVSAEPVRPASAKAMHACLRRHGLLHACLPHYSPDPYSATSVKSSMATTGISNTGRPGRSRGRRVPLHNSVCLARSTVPAEMSLSGHSKFLKDAKARAATGSSSTLNASSARPKSAASKVRESRSCADRCRENHMVLEKTLGEKRIEKAQKEAETASVQERLRSLQEQLDFEQGSIEAAEEKLQLQARELTYRQQTIDLLHARVAELEQDKMARSYKLEEYRDMASALDTVVHEHSFESPAQALLRFEKLEENQMRIVKQNDKLTETGERLELKLKTEISTAETLRNQLLQNEAKSAHENKKLAAACKSGAAPLQMLSEKTQELNSIAAKVIQMLKKYRTDNVDPGEPDEHDIEDLLRAFDSVVERRLSGEATGTSNERRTLYSISASTQSLWRKYFAAQHPQDMMRPIRILVYTDELVDKLTKQVKVMQRTTREAEEKAEIAEDKQKEIQVECRRHKEEMKTMRRWIRQNAITDDSKIHYHQIGNPDE